MLRLLLVDDEPLAHQVLLHHLKVEPDVEVIAHCYNAAEALAVLAHKSVDLMLLDIRMPILTGIEMLTVLAQRPQVIITSAYPQYAIEGFALDVVDYLLKPVSQPRFAQALEKVRRRLMAEPTTPATIHKIVAVATPAQEYVVLKVERELRKFLLASICCFEAYGNYVKVWQDNRMTLVNATLKQLRNQLPTTHFSQVHKSFLVAHDHVISRDSQQLILSNHMTVKIGDAYKEQAKQLLTPD